MSVGIMGHKRNSDKNATQSERTSDEQEITGLIEDLISLDTIPTEVVNEAEELYDSGNHHQALNVLLESLN